MADGTLVEALNTLVARFQELAAREEGLRHALRAAARAVLDATESPAPEAPTVEAAPATASTPATASREATPASPSSPPPPRVSATDLMVKLWTGRARLPRGVGAQTPPPPPAVPPKNTAAQAIPVSRLDAGLIPLGERCRLKAEGARWAATRRRRIDEGADVRDEIAPRDRQILDRAGELRCYLWMNSPDFPLPNGLAAMEDLAGWFDAVADAIELVSEVNPEVQANRAFFEPALDLLARAQSALRVAVEAVDGPRDDEQFGVYNWLREVTAREQIFIRHHMRLDDPADPSLLLDFDAELERLEDRFRGNRADTKHRKSALGALRYHAKLIAQGDPDPDHHWKKLADAVDSLMQAGVQASSVEVREALLPILERMPDQDEFLRPNVRLVLREVDRYLAGRNTSTEPAADDLPTPQVAEVARLLRGKQVLLIGGSRRNFAHKALRQAFELQELIWFETREHESIEVFGPHVARPDVALVLLAIRWSSHSFEGVKRFCDEHGKPMVRLPAGYGVNQVAAQILAQVSGRLQPD